MPAPMSCALPMSRRAPCPHSCLGALVCLNDNWMNSVGPNNNDGCLAKLQGRMCIQRNGDENLPFDVCGGECTARCW
jgi:hypothetical protein